MNGPARIDSDGPRAETDLKGAFILTATTPATTACIAHPGGYAQLPLVELIASRAVRLQAWGRIAGSLKIGGRVASNERIWLINTPSGLYAMLTANTDAEGHFIFEGLPPGRWELSHQPKLTAPPADGRFIRRQFGAAAIPLTQKVEVYVKPGLTTQVELGGAGRRVVGSARANVPGSRVYFQGELVGLAQSSAGPGSRQAEPISSEVPVQGQGQRDLRQYVLVFDSDGTFRIDDVLPGSYELEISAWDQRQEDSPFALWEPFAPVTLAVTVPEAAGDEDAPIDLGVLEVDLERPWDLGRP